VGLYGAHQRNKVREKGQLKNIWYGWGGVTAEGKEKKKTSEKKGMEGTVKGYAIRKVKKEKKEAKVTYGPRGKTVRKDKTLRGRHQQIGNVLVGRKKKKKVQVGAKKTGSKENDKRGSRKIRGKNWPHKKRTSKKGKEGERLEKTQGGRKSWGEQGSMRKSGPNSPKIEGVTGECFQAKKKLGGGRGAAMRELG